MIDLERLVEELTLVYPNFFQLPPEMISIKGLFKELGLKLRFFEQFSNYDPMACVHIKRLKEKKSFPESRYEFENYLVPVSIIKGVQDYLQDEIFGQTSELATRLKHPEKVKFDLISIIRINWQQFKSDMVVTFGSLFGFTFLPTNQMKHQQEYSIRKRYERNLSRINSKRHQEEVLYLHLDGYFGDLDQLNDAGFDISSFQENDL